MTVNPTMNWARDAAVHDALDMLTRVRHLAGDHLPPALAAAMGARDRLTAVVRPTLTAEQAHAEAVRDLLSDATTSMTTPDPVQHAKKVTAAERADAERSTANRVLTDAMHQADVRLLAVAAEQSLAVLTDVLRPVALAAYDRLDEVAQRLPAGASTDHPLQHGPHAASDLAVLSEAVATLDACYEVRGELSYHGGLPKRRIDLGNQFARCSDLWRYEDSRPIYGGQHSNLTPDGLTVLPNPRWSTAWHLALARQGAQWWFPSPAEQDQLCSDYIARAEAGEVEDAYVR